MALDKFTQITKSGIVTTINFECHHLHSTGIATFSSGSISAVDGTFTGDVSIGGTLTYQDVTNIDSVGLVTARLGLNVTAGVSTFAALIDANGGVDISGGSGLVASTAKISDLTDNRVVIGGSSGELEDSANLTFDGSNLGVGSKVTITNANADADNPNSLGADINAAWIRIGDVTSAKSFSNGLGIKFHDQGTAHWSAGIIGNKFYISQTSTDGNKLFPSSSADVLTLDNTGKLGINYTSPSTIIHAIGNNTVGTSVTCKLQSHDTANATANIELSARRSDNTAQLCRIRAASGGTSSVDLQFHTNNTEKLRITSAGLVGIGTNNPVVKLTTTVTHSNSAVVDALRLTTTGTYSQPNSEEAGSAISFGQYHNTYPTWNLGRVAGIRDGNSWHGSLSFWTNDGNGATDISEKVRITSDGHLGINRTTPVAPITARRKDAGGSNTAGVIAEFANNGGYGVWFGQSSATGAAWGSTTGDFYWCTNGLSSQVERLRIDSSGRLQLGNINGNTQWGLDLVNIESGGDAGISIGRLEGGSPTSGQVLGSYSFQSAIGSQNAGSAEAKIQAVAAETMSGTSAATDLVFFTKPTGTGPGSSPTERLRISSDGDILLSNGGMNAPIFNNLGNNHKILDIYGGGTSNKAGILALSGNTATDNTIVGALWFNNHNNSSSGSGNANSKMLGGFEMRTITSDSNAGDDCGGYLRWLAKGEASGVTESGRVTHQGLGLGVWSAGPSYIDNPLCIQPANDKGIKIYRPGDSSGNTHLHLTTTKAGSAFPSGEAYTVKYKTMNCDQIFETYEGGGTGGNISFRSAGSNPGVEKFRITRYNTFAYHGTGAANYALQCPNVNDTNICFVNTAGHAANGTFAGMQFNCSGNSQNRVGYIGMISQYNNNRYASLVFGTDNTGNRAEAMRIEADNGNAIRCNYNTPDETYYPSRAYRRTLTANNSGAHWYRIAKLAARSKYRIHCATTGGWYTPGTVSFTVLRNWDNTTFWVGEIDKLGGTYTTATRMQSDNQGGEYYLEIYFNSVNSNQLNSFLTVTIETMSASSHTNRAYIQQYGEDASNLTYTSSQTNL